VFAWSSSAHAKPSPPRNAWLVVQNVVGLVPTVLALVGWLVLLARSLWSRDAEDEILPTVRELGIGFVAYSPLGRGFLTGRIRSIDDLEPDDYRRNSPRFQGENFRDNLRLVDDIEAIAAEHRCTPAQLALAWVLEQGDDIVPIPGTKRRRYLEENAGALAVQLTDDDRARINRVLAPGAAAGARYAPHALRAVNR